MAKYRMATLFSGAGGLDTAFEESENFDLVFANDVLSAPAESYSKNFSHKIVDAKDFGESTKLPAYVVGDVTNIDFSPIGKVDCMIGGPPCQALTYIAIILIFSKRADIIWQRITRMLMLQTPQSGRF